MIITEKRCTKCGEVKPLAEFPAKKSSRDLHSSWCKICYCAHQRQKYVPKGKPKARKWEIYRDEQTKSCSKCGQVKSFSEFHPKKGVRDGRSSWCIDCVHIHQRSRYQPKPIPQRSEVSVYLPDPMPKPRPAPKSVKEKVHVEPGMKICTRCDAIKPLAEFAKKASAPDGIGGWCKNCMRDTAKKHHYQMKAQVIAQPPAIPDSKTCGRCNETKPASEFGKHTLKGISDWCKSCMSKYRIETLSNKRSNLKRKYGLTLEQYHQMHEFQSNLCAICKQIPTGKHGLVLDHDHATGKFRGLLCSGCNVNLGRVESKKVFKRNNLSPSFVEAAKRYLENPPGEAFLKGA